VEWTANVPTAGAYALSFRYALQSTQARQLAIRVNGTLVNSALTFPPTISFTSWTYVSLTANLQAGANTIRATATGTSGPNLDHLRISAASGARVAGASQEDLADAVQLYPVPVDQVLTVVTPDAATAQLRLTGAQGVALKPTILERGASHIRLDVSGLKNGFYLLTVQTPRGQVTKRVVIGR
jgi:hypothetical protein